MKGKKGVEKKGSVTNDNLNDSYLSPTPLIFLEDEAIIDVGGGASLLVDYLCKEGFVNLTVLDISENALNSAKKRLGDSAKNIEWYEADITEYKPPHQFSL